jgi:hypothetical protein
MRPGVSALRPAQLRAGLRGELTALNLGRSRNKTPSTQVNPNVKTSPGHGLDSARTGPL